MGDEWDQWASFSPYGHSGYSQGYSSGYSRTSRGGGGGSGWSGGGGGGGGGSAWSGGGGGGGQHSRDRRHASGHAPQSAQHAASSSQGGKDGGKRNNNAAVSPLEDLMRRKGVEEAWEALDDMQRAGMPTDRFTISRMLMRTLAEGRRQWEPAKIQRSVELVERFVQQQPEEADEVLFNALLDTHSRLKDIPRLEAAFKRMKQLNIEPSHVTLGILVKAYGQVCDIRQVMKLWDEMAVQRRQANAVTYGCMINACVKCGQTEKAAEIFRDMKLQQKHCNTILYTTLIKGYGNEKDLEKAIALFREMRDEGVPYNTIAYNSIIDVCIKCGDVEAAEEFFRDMLASSSNVQPDLITYSTLLKGYCQVGDLDKALQVAETIKACGLKCDELVYNTLMDGCVKANDLSAGVGLFAEMTQSGMKPSSITHSIFLRLYQRNGYKQNASDAVAQLYQHHGLERPPQASLERSKGSTRRADKKSRMRTQEGQGQSEPGRPRGQGRQPAPLPLHYMDQNPHSPCGGALSDGYRGGPPTASQLPLTASPHLEDLPDPLGGDSMVPYGMFSDTRLSRPAFGMFGGGGASLIPTDGDPSLPPYNPGSPQGGMIIGVIPSRPATWGSVSAAEEGMNMPFSSGGWTAPDVERL